MKTPNEQNKMARRTFLGRASGVFGMAMVGGWTGFRAEAEPKPMSREAVEKAIAYIDLKGKEFFAIPKTDGQFLNLMVKATRAKNVLEVGTAFGFTAIWLSLGLEETGGHLTTVEILSERVAAAKKHVAETGLSHRVTFLEGNAHQLVPTLAGPFDFVLLAADKQGTLDYFNKLYPKKLPPGGLLIVPNAIRLQEKMQDYLAMISKHPDFDSVIVSPTPEDAFSVSYRKRG